MAAAIRDCSTVYTFVDMVRQGTVVDTLPTAGSPDDLVTTCSFTVYLLTSNKGGIWHVRVRREIHTQFGLEDVGVDERIILKWILEK